jgi:hypothetical protein
VRRRADLFMRIPMKGAVGSLNAAVAGSILLFEALAQRDPNAAPRTPMERPDVAEAKPRVRKGLSTEPADPEAGAVLDPEGAKPEAAEPASPKRRVRRGLATEPSEPATTEPAATELEPQPDGLEPVAPKPRARKTRSTDPADAATTEPQAAIVPQPVAAQPAPRKARSRKGAAASGSTNGPKSSAEASRVAEDDLLPADGAKKRSRKAPERT